MELIKGNWYRIVAEGETYSNQDLRAQDRKLYQYKGHLMNADENRIHIRIGRDRVSIGKSTIVRIDQLVYNNRMEVVVVHTEEGLNHLPSTIAG